MKKTISIFFATIISLFLFGCTSITPQNNTHTFNFSVEKGNKVIYSTRVSALEGQKTPINFQRETTYPSKITFKNDKEIISPSSVQEGLELNFIPNSTNDNRMIVHIIGSYDDLIALKTFKDTSGSEIQFPEIQTLKFSQTLALSPNQETSFAVVNQKDKDAFYKFKIIYVKP